MTSFYSYNPRLDGLGLKARQARSYYKKVAASAERLNRKAVQQMGEWAAQDLRRHMRRGRGGRTGTLENALVSRESHYADADGFKFILVDRFDEEVVNPERPEKGTYWRAIEYGSRHALGFRLPLSFFDPFDYGKHPDPKRAGKRLRRAKYGLPVGAFVGGKDRFEKHLGGFVTVKKAIMPYHYAQYAEDRFLADDKGYYRGLVVNEVARLGTAPAGRLQMER